MRTRKDANTLASSTEPSSPLAPTQVFDPDFLALLTRRDEPYTGSEADVAGPHHLEETGRVPVEHAVLRQGESLRRGDPPLAVFLSEDAAQLCCAVLPGTGRTGRYVVVPHPDSEGFPVMRDNQLAGHMPLFDPDLIAAMNVADSLISSPDCFAWLLEAAGGLLLQATGKIVLERALK